MASTMALDNIMPVSELGHGGVGKAIGRTEDGNPSSNKPAAVIITPDDYRRYTEADVDFALYLEAVKRMNRDDGTRRTMGEVSVATIIRWMTDSTRNSTDVVKVERASLGSSGALCM